MQFHILLVHTVVSHWLGLALLSLDTAVYNEVCRVFDRKTRGVCQCQLSVSTRYEPGRELENPRVMMCLSVPL